MSEHINQILALKGSEVWSTTPDTSVCDATRLMAKEGIGALVVLENEKVVGIFGERDYLTKVDLCGHSSQNTTVRQVMSEEVYSVTPQTSVDEAMAIVTNSRNRHLPVLEKGQLVGLVSIGDLVKALLDEKDFTIKQLNKYIKGEP